MIEIFPLYKWGIFAYIRYSIIHKHTKHEEIDYSINKRLPDKTLHQPIKYKR